MRNRSKISHQGSLRLTSRRRDWATASVCWQKDAVYIVLVRRSDAALGFVDLPDAAAPLLPYFSVEAVVENEAMLRAAVTAALPSLVFEDDRGGASAPGPCPAVLGKVRRFKDRLFGVDIGEFEVPVSPPWWM